MVWKRLELSLLFVVFLAVRPGLAYATLGEAPLDAGTKTSSTEPYEVHELTLQASRVLEYSTPGGAVFAVTWSGTRPDLSVLLGPANFSEYAAAVPNGPRQDRRKSLTVSTPNIVVKETGRMRAFQGLAYLPRLVPPGVSVETLP